MRELQIKGTARREQAVIARTHKILQKIAEKIEKRGIPVLYIGNWLESEKVRDLLCWLALVGGDKYALVRVAKFSAYKISFADVQRVISDSTDNKTSITEAINSLSSGPDFDKLSKDFLPLPSDA